MTGGILLFNVIQGGVTISKIITVINNKKQII